MEKDSSATPYNIQLSAKDTPGAVHKDGITQGSAERASELLLLNHAKYHALFNEAGLHNHILHHLLTIYSLGASPAEIQQAYDLNKKYQLPTIAHSAEIASRLRDPEFFKEHLGDNDYYRNYLKFFQDEIAEKGMEDVVNEFVFKGDARANDMLMRMYSGFLHPILHLGFGLEYSQPCIVAESLASAAIHDDWPVHALEPAEKFARERSPLSDTTLISLAEQLRADPEVSTAVHHRDSPNKVVSGLYRRAKDETIGIISQYTVAAHELDRKTAEMMHFCTYLSGAAQNPRKVEMFDFFLMHSTNLSVFYTTFAKLSWIPLQARCRLLEWKGRMDLILYAACRTPALYPARITTYRPKSPASDWESIFARACAYRDDGHTSKLIRAIRNAESASGPYMGQIGFPLAQEDFLTIAHMVMDSVERMDEPGYEIPDGPSKLYRRFGLEEEVLKVIVRWVRWCGIEEAWSYVPDRPKGAML